MAINLTPLNNISTFEVNTSLINESSTLAPNLVSNANTATNGYFGLGMLIVLFIFMMIIFMQDNEVFRFTFPQAFLGASGICTLVGIVLLVSDMISSFQHVMWFAILFLIALVVVYNNRN